jgi:hypothetical protein
MIADSVEYGVRRITGIVYEIDMLSQDNGFTDVGIFPAPDAFRQREFPGG